MDVLEGLNVLVTISGMLLVCCWDDRDLQVYTGRKGHHLSSEKLSSLADSDTIHYSSVVGVRSPVL